MAKCSFTNSTKHLLNTTSGKKSTYRANVHIFSVFVNKWTLQNFIWFYMSLKISENPENLKFLWMNIHWTGKLVTHFKLVPEKGHVVIIEKRWNFTLRSNFTLYRKRAVRFLIRTFCRRSFCFLFFRFLEIPIYFEFSHFSILNRTCQNLVRFTSRILYNRKSVNRTEKGVRLVKFCFDWFELSHFSEAETGF